MSIMGAVPVIRTVAFDGEGQEARIQVDLKDNEIGIDILSPEDCVGAFLTPSQALALSQALRTAYDTWLKTAPRC